MYNKFKKILLCDNLRREYCLLDLIRLIYIYRFFFIKTILFTIFAAQQRKTTQLINKLQRQMSDGWLFYIARTRTM